MKKKIVLILVCILLITYSLFIVNPIKSLKVKGNTLYVGGDGQGNYTRIQDAIDNASSGDTVFVYNGIYYENVVIIKVLNLFGENKTNTIIDGVEKDSIIKIRADNVMVSGFTIRNSKNDYIYAGVEIAGNNATIIHNIIKDNYIRIDVWNCYINYTRKTFFGNIISNNIILNSTFMGIWLLDCMYSVITNNEISDSGFSAIHLLSSNKSTVKGNIIYDNDFGITVYDSSKNEILFNDIKDNNFGIFFLNSIHNIISNNNFCECRKNVKLLYYKGNIRLNRWSENYWDNLYGNYYIIFGKICIWSVFGIIPWIEIDWHPAQEPYDIPLPDVP